MSVIFLSTPQIALVGIPIAVILFVLSLMATESGYMRFSANEVNVRVAVSEDIICEELRNLSYKCKNVRKGEGMSVKRAKQLIDGAHRYYQKKSCKGELYEFERWLLENNYVLKEALAQCADSFHHLPHIGGRPRIYYVAKLIVELSEARITHQQLMGYLKSFLIECKLEFAELEAFNDMLTLVLCEYAAVFCRMRLQDDEDKESMARRLARYNSLVGSCITTLRNRAQLLPTALMLTLCAANQYFCKEKAGVYACMRVESRAEYLRQNARLAKKMRIDEQECAQNVVRTASNQGIHIGQLLIKKSLPYALQHIYLALIIVITAFELAALYFLVEQQWARVLVVVFSIVPAFSAARTLLNAFILNKSAPHFLPAMDFSQYIPKEHCTLVVVPELLRSVQDFERARAHILTLKAANCAKNIYFGLLIDFASSEKECLNDEEKQIVALCASLSDEHNINIYIRKRQYEPVSQKYKAFERKRGALMCLNSHLIAQNEQWEYISQHNSSKIANVITLDADTFINCAVQLIECMAHPLNESYAVIAPSIKAQIICNPSPFSTIFEGGAGFDSYSFAHSDFGSRVFGCGNYMGKGIYNVHRFMEAVKGKLPCNRVLSHDFIEGALCGTVNCQLAGLDLFPQSFREFFERQLRWTRGDWQLLPFLRNRIKGEDESTYKSPLQAYQKFQIINNLAYSMLPVCGLALVIISLFCSSLLPLIIAFFYLLIPFIGDLVMGIAALAYRQRISTILIHRLKSAIRLLFCAAVLPSVAIYSLAAIVKTLYRLTISKKNLLDWTTSLEVGSDGEAEGVAQYLKMFAPQIAIAVVILPLAVLFSPLPQFFCFYAALLFFAPLICAISARRRGKRELCQKDREFLIEQARLIWKYFEDCLTEQNNYLPCDNYSQQKGFAQRTSPTNIGFALLAVCCAQELGFIPQKDAHDYIDKMLSTLERLQKYEGNLYNWYNTATLEVLLPRYVSSVDSGNLLACMLTVRSMLENFNLIQRIDRLIDATSLSALYNKKLGLLSVGYDEGASTMSDAHYDLLASECTLTYLVGYALGKLPKQAVERLSRTHVKYSKMTLYSWTGGMFEYLMSGLFLDFAPRTMIGISAQNAVKAHKKYAKEQNLSSFGISESQYNLKIDGDYQYKAFGVPQIALKSNAEQGRCIAPYAAFLAAELSIKHMDNLKRLSQYSGKYGMIEAVDFSKSQHKICSFMAHHLGMSLLSCANLLLENSPKRRLNGLSQIAAATMLLNQTAPTERAAKKIITSCPMQVEQAELVRYSKHGKGAVQLMENGKYSAIISSEGTGFSSFNQTPLNYFNGESGGIEIFANGESVFEGSQCSFTLGAANFCKLANSLKIDVSAIVPPLICGEMRIVTIKNLGAPREVTLQSRILPTLAPRSEIMAHPAFSRLFLTAFFDNLNKCAVAYRANRKDAIFLAHGVAHGAFDYSLSRSGNSQSPIDPALSTSMKIQLDKGEQKRIAYYVAAAHSIEDLVREVNAFKCANFEASALSLSTDYFSYANELGEEELRLVYGALAKMNYINRFNVGSQRELLYPSNKIRKEDIVLAQDLGVNINHPILLINFSRFSLGAFKKRIAAITKIMSACFPFSVVILYKESSGYLSPMREMILQCLDEAQFYQRMPSACYAFILNESEIGAEAAASICALADVEA